MKRFTRYVAALTALVVSTSLVLALTGWGNAFAANVSGVFITNSTSNPVPVDGTVKVDSTAASPVLVGGMVSISGSPSVELASGSTVDLANHLAQAFDIDVRFALADGEALATKSFSVPPGKAFVIEHVNAEANVPPGNGAELQLELRSVQDSNSALYESIPLTQETATNTCCSAFVDDEDVTLVAGPYTNSVLFFRGPASAGEAEARVTLSGYLADAPS
jgi:hypothetical protein